MTRVLAEELKLQRLRPFGKIFSPRNTKTMERLLTDGGHSVIDVGSTELVHSSLPIGV